MTVAMIITTMRVAIMTTSGCDDDNDSTDDGNEDSDDSDEEKIDNRGRRQMKNKDAKKGIGCVQHSWHRQLT